MSVKATTAAFASASPAPIPRLDGVVPVFGHGVALRRDPTNLLLRGWREHGELFDISIFGQTFTVFLGPEAHEAYFRAPDGVLSQMEVYQFTVPIFGRGVAYDASPELMAEQVAFLYPAVRESRLQSYAEHMFDETVAHIDDWGDEGEIDLLETMNVLTVNIACRCLLETRDPAAVIQRVRPSLSRPSAWHKSDRFLLPAPVDARAPQTRRSSPPGGQCDRRYSCRASAPRPGGRGFHADLDGRPIR